MQNKPKEKEKRDEWMLSLPENRVSKSEFIINYFFFFS